MSETKASRLERYRIEGAVDFINGVIQGAREQDDAGLLLCAENAEKAIRCLRVDLASTRAELSSRDAEVARLRTALAVCVEALGLAHGFVQEELNVRVKSHTLHGDTATLDEDGITICGEATDCLATIEIGRDAGKAALTKDA